MNQTELNITKSNKDNKMIGVIVERMTGITGN